jgi:hypothetical protein
VVSPRIVSLKFDLRVKYPIALDPYRVLTYRKIPLKTHNPTLIHLEPSYHHQSPTRIAKTGRATPHQCHFLTNWHLSGLTITLIEPPPRGQIDAPTAAGHRQPSCWLLALLGASANLSSTTTALISHQLSSSTSHSVSSQMELSCGQEEAIVNNGLERKKCGP